MCLRRWKCGGLEDSVRGCADLRVCVPAGLQLMGPVEAGEVGVGVMPPVLQLCLSASAPLLPEQLMALLRLY
jgi:hypothetical protein